MLLGALNDKDRMRMYLSRLIWGFGILGFLGTEASCVDFRASEPHLKSGSGQESRSLNDRVLLAIEHMPVGGRYAANRVANQGLGRAIRWNVKGEFAVDVTVAQPSYCSGATYLVLLGALKSEIDGIQDPTDRAELAHRLKIEGQPDGVGLWGRWNSNGPCMAVWFAESGMGYSFEDYASARPGDFLKLWWTDAMGRDESGHSVVFLGYSVTQDGEPGVEIWSSNKPLGYGKKVVPYTKIRYALFSRCDHPERVMNLMHLPERNEVLAGMLKRNVTREEIESIIKLK